MPLDLEYLFEEIDPDSEEIPINEYMAMCIEHALEILWEQTEKEIAADKLKEIDNQLIVKEKEPEDLEDQRTLL